MKCFVFTLLPNLDDMIFVYQTEIGIFINKNAFQQDAAVAAGGGVCLEGALSAQAGCLPDTPSPCEQNDWQTLVKILPCHNFVADSNKNAFK